MAKIIHTYINKPPKKNSVCKQLIAISLSAYAVLCYLFFCRSGIYELIYGIGLCTLQPLATTAANVSLPYVVAIDPGHGGLDTGAQSIVNEIVVIDMTTGYLYELLEKDPDFIPVLTRTTTDPESVRRAEIANSADARLFISIHANSDSHKSSKGFECFPRPPGRKHHVQSLMFAQLVVEQMRTAGHKIRGGEEKTGIKYAYYYGNEKRIVDSSDNKVRSRKSFGILENANCPSLLVEQCFISNQDDVNNWTGEYGCKKAAELYYTAIKEYFQLLASY